MESVLRLIISMTICATNMMNIFPFMVEVLWLRSLDRSSEFFRSSNQ